MITSPGWTPSAGRTIAPNANPAPSLRGVTAVRLPLAWPEKAPVDQLDYSLDLSGWLSDANDTLLTVDASASPSNDPQDVQVQWASIVSGLVTLMLTGGRPGFGYTIAAQVRSAAGRVALFDVSLQITTDAAAAPATAASLPPNVLVDASGTALFLAAATPLLLA